MISLEYIFPNKKKVYKKQKQKTNRKQNTKKKRLIFGRVLGDLSVYPYCSMLKVTHTNVKLAICAHIIPSEVVHKRIIMKGFCFYSVNYIATCNFP